MITTFDPLFAKYASGIPVAYLRALATKESSMNPSSVTGSYVGILQVGPSVLDSYNGRYGTHYTKADLYNPEINIQLAVDTIKRIVTAYAKHPSKNLKTNWANPEFVKLVTAGWNSGYSEAGGVGKVASYLEAKGLPVTHDNVFSNAAAAGATQHLANTAKQSWQRSVAALFYAQPDWAKVGMGAGVLLLIGGTVLLFLYLRKKR